MPLYNIARIDVGSCAGASPLASSQNTINCARSREVIEGRLDPIKGMMEGKLKLTRGHLPTMIRFVEASRQLVVSAAHVPTRFVH